MNLTQQTGNNRSKRIPVFAAGIALALCLAAVVAVRFKTYDPSVPAESETILDYCLFAGVWLVPFASVCFAKRLFEGRRFRFALSWLVGFLIPWLLLAHPAGRKLLHRGRAESWIRRHDCNHIGRD